jgi:hypothetical protein
LSCVSEEPGIAGLPESHHASTKSLRALRQREQVIGLHAVGFCLDVLVAIVSGDNHFHSPSGAVHEELLASLNFGDASRLSDFESTTRCANSANVLNSFVRVKAISLVDALNLMVSHSDAFPAVGRL